MTRIDRNFFLNDAVTVARQLPGMEIVTGSGSERLHDNRDGGLHGLTVTGPLMPAGEGLPERSRCSWKEDICIFTLSTECTGC